MDPNQNSDAAVSGQPPADTPAPDGVSAAGNGTAAEGQAGEQGKQGQPPESSTGNQESDNYQARVDELTGKYRGAQRDAEYWQERALNAEKQIPAPEPQITLDKTLEDFGGDVQQYTKYVADEAVKATQQATDESAQRTTAEDNRREFMQRENDFAGQVENYDEVTRNPALQISEDMKAFIESDEKGPELLFFLGNHPDIAAKISMLPPMQVGAEMARLQVTELSKPETSNTQTPAPITPLRGTEHATAIDVHSPDSDQLPMKEWAKRWKKKEVDKASRQ